MAVTWTVDEKRTGPNVLSEVAVFGTLALRVTGLRARWGHVLSPPQDLAEQWAWEVSKPGGELVAFGMLCATQAEAERMAAEVAAMYVERLYAVS